MYLNSSLTTFWYITLHDRNQMFGYVNNMFGSTFTYIMSPKQNGMQAVTIQVLFSRTTMLNDQEYRYLFISILKSTYQLLLIIVLVVVQFK